MKVLVVGGGGREHAIAWRLSQSEKIQQVFVAPGNAGTALERDLTNVHITNVAALRDWALANKIGLTVVGPEQPLSEGIVDDFRAHGLRIFGPTQAAARLESSKAYSKAFMKRHGIPTANYEVFTDSQAAKAYVRSQGAPIVIKADGLAAGKGVVVAQTLDQALDAVDEMLGHHAHAPGAAQIVVEEFLTGEEASFMVVVDGHNVVPLATSQDHKRLLDGDLGPNTGGMGAYSPAPVVTPEVHAKAMREIILPTIKGLQKEGIQYTGFLYAGLMISSQGEVKTLEFNCRLGDPETQPLLMRLKSDFFELMLAATDNGLGTLNLDWDRRAALGVVLAVRGYPHAPVKGDVINGLPATGDAGELICKVFHAGTALQGEQVLTDGGRVLCVTALGHSLKEAKKAAYEQVDLIHFHGQQARRDIGHKAL
jgi:phosphoribosylamine--glycine ligase